MAKVMKHTPNSILIKYILLSFIEIIPFIVGIILYYFYRKIDYLAISFAVGILLYLVFISKRKMLRSGYNGEKRVLNTLKTSLDRNYVIFPDIVLKNEDKTSQIDLIVIGKCKIFLLEVKNFKGKITGNGMDQNLKFESKTGAGNSNRYNPMKQNMVHKYFLQSIFRKSLSFQPNIEPVVVFSDPGTEINIYNNPMAILRINELPHFILQNDFGYEFREEKKEIIKIIKENKE